MTSAAPAGKAPPDAGQRVEGQNRAGRSIRSPLPTDEILLRANQRVGIRLRSLLLVRWIAVAGQAATAAIVLWGLKFPFPILPVAGLIGFSALLNLAIDLSRPRTARLSDPEAATFLGFDILQLTVLLFLTGGITNPFSILLLAPAAIAASALTRRSVVLLCAATLACATLIAIWHEPLPWSGEPPQLPDIYRAAVWGSLTLAVALTTFYTWKTAEEARRMGDALSATSAALAHEQRLAALGALAASAAHELGSPLSTISVVAHEMRREVEPDDPLREDIELLAEQAERCRAILARLSVDPVGDMSEAYTVIPVPALVEAAATPWAIESVELTFSAGPARPDGPALAPVMVRGPEFLQGLGNVVHNAVGFARARVDVATTWATDWIQISVSDDGPGFPEPILDEIGAPFLSSRAGRDGHMGLGAFIAKTLLERTGAVVRFANRPASEGGGARVTARWRNPVFRST